MVYVSIGPTSPTDRIAPRHLFEARMQIRWQRENQKLVAQGWTRDLSESGLSAFVADMLIVGELVSLEVPLSSSQRLVIPAKVARCRGTEYGFQFTALSLEQRTLMRGILQDKPEIPFLKG